MIEELIEAVQAMSEEIQRLESRLAAAELRIEQLSKEKSYRRAR